MKSKLMKCWLFIMVAALAIVLGNAERALAQCGLSFTGPAGNTLTSFIDIYPNYPNCDAYFNTIVQTTNQPLPMGTYLTWCVDANTFIDPSQGYTVPGTVYTGYLLPSCDPNLNMELPSDHPATCYVAPSVWQQVNYILNHKNNAYFWDIEVALTTLVGGPPQGPSPPYPPFDTNIVNALLSAAASNAPAWTPQPGNVIGAVYVITNQAGIGTLTNAVQFELIEVPYCPVTISQCPTNINLGCNPASIPTGNASNIVATSACGYPVTVSVTTTQAVAGCTHYEYITYTASDSYGDSAKCTQTIKWTVDTTAPVLINAPASTNLGYNPITLPTDASVSNLVVFSESCSSPVISVSHVDSGTPCASVRTFYISAIDACGNNSLTNTVVYNYVIDTNAPVIISVPPGTNFGCSYTSLPTTNSILTNMVASDNCTVVSTNITSTSVTNGSTVTLTYTITVKDEAGNVSKPATVVYTYTISTGPSLVCAADITITGTNTSPAITGTPSLVDSCGNPVVCSNYTVTVTTNYYSIYCDSFTNNPCSLNGRGPDLTNLLGLKWCASTWVADGTQACITNSCANALLPFQPLQGYLYQISADMECIGGSKTTPTSDWVALGFANGTNTSSWWQTANNPVGWQLARNSGNTSYCGQAFIGSGTSGAVNNGYYPTNLTHYCVVLDARPTNAGAWTFTFLANGQVVTPPTACGGNGPTITTCGFGSYCNPVSGGVCHVKNFCACYGIPTLVTNYSCTNPTYTDKVVTNGCAGKIHIVRTWYGWDNQGRTNTCTQNIYETVALPAVTFASTTTSLGCSPSTLPTTSTVASLVIGYSGLSSTNITYVTTTNGCNVTRTFTVTVSDSCGDVSPAATLVYTWVNANPSVGCWVSGPASGTCLSACNYTCWVTNLGNCAFSSCTLTACGQTFTCPALNPGQGCAITIPHTFQTCDLGTFVCQPVCSAVCATPCSPTCSAQSSCKTTVCGNPGCKISVSGPSSGWCFSPCTYNCCVTNTGTCPFAACTLTACGQTVSCPALQPGQGCVIPVTHTFQLFELGWFNCQANVSANCAYSTAPTCSAQSSCGTSVGWW